jgi:methylated-DNA-[protein]-cysteine S-methyltransferase
MMQTAIIATPVGDLHLAAVDGALVAVSFSPLTGGTADADPAGAVTAIQRYLAGDVLALDSLRVAPEGTEHQRKVWQELRRIEPGAPITYGELARRIGNPAASRAVGAANGQNPIAIVIPCHRVIATGGALGGYAGGLERKRWLLDHEARHTPFALSLR